jgi:O-acetyl-ADP-ribose deacetylase (regulator of RNase III)
MPVDAIVNPSNSMGIMGGGISGLLRRQGGEVIQQAAMQASPIAVGAAIVTTAGQLPAKHVIHVPTMEEPGMKIGAENVRRAARAALIAADRNNFKTIAIPGIGTDLGDVPIDEAARAIVEEIRAHRRPNPETIYLVDTSEEMLFSLEDALRNAQANL